MIPFYYPASRVSPVREGALKRWPHLACPLAQTVKPMGHHRVLSTAQMKRRISRLLRVLSHGLSPNQFSDLLADFLSQGGTRKSDRVDLSLKEYIDKHKHTPWTCGNAGMPPHSLERWKARKVLKKAKFLLKFFLMHMYVWATVRFWGWGFPVLTTP